MVVDDTVLDEIVKVFQSTENVLRPLASGEKTDASGIIKFSGEIIRIVPIIQKLPEPIRGICGSLVELPLLLDRSTALMDKKEAKQFHDAQNELIDALLNAFAI